MLKDVWWSPQRSVLQEFALRSHAILAHHHPRRLFPLMSNTSQLSDAHTRIYLTLLKSLSLNDPSLKDIELDLTLGAILNEPNSEAKNVMTNNNENELSALGASEANPSPPKQLGVFREEELLTFGTPARHHLNASSRQRLLEDIQSTLRSMAEFLCGDKEGIKDENISSIIPEALQVYKDELSTARGAIVTGSNRIVALILEISKMRESLEYELKQAISITLPTLETTRTASIDLLAATVEASLVKLSLIKARSERSLYNQQFNGKDDNTMAHAIVAAHGALKRDEQEMKAEANSLDRQLQEYESLLKLVDGGSGGYQQIINDWTKVKQGTDECLKDLRRLGWTGD
ncbi:hypothetical protein M413DRAFT_442475 [Hebeloma cylindrosporum]|uniref:Uncharacterized protein n=1 Tax=Hebeloma cylindrosporum TaxID=76867 RepID=A0A0C3CK53_HEBCY|nr:hypothetical protein M413DRAFT_442475 [Hebeloma cylindrosporum h7]